MSGSSNPSISQQNEGNQTEPYSGGSSASSLGAPAPDPDEQNPQGNDGSDPAGSPNEDVKGDPEQVT